MPAGETYAANFAKILAIALLLNLAAFGQSLGDVARANREKQQAGDASGATPKVITNKDLGEPERDPDAPDVQPQTRPASPAANSHTAEELRTQQREAEQWRNKIVEQESKVASLRARINQLDSWIHSSLGTVQTEGPYNRRAAREVERLAELRQQLDEQSRKLDAMQESARRAGMHTATYDP